MIFFESDIVELKSVVTNEICKEVIAFANTKGGTIHIGIADDGTVIGVENADQAILQINNMIRDSIKPDITMFVSYKANTMQSKNIVTVAVQRGTARPYYLSGKGLKPSGVFVRNGTSCDPATDTSIRSMIKETDGDSFESMRSLEQKLSFNTAKELFSSKNIPFDSLKMKSLGILSPDGIYSNAAMLISDQCSSTIKAATFSGTDKTVFHDRREFEGSVFRQMEEMYAYLDLRNRTQSTFKGLYRTDIRDYPEEALREALLNSLVHRDYSFSASTLISVYDDRIEFVSIGGLPLGISLSDVMLGLSVCRNPKLAAIFYRLELIEAYGTGIPKIFKAYADFEPQPKIEVTENAFKITLPNRNAAYESKKTAVHAAASSDAVILEYIERNGEVTRNDVEKLLSISTSTSNRILRSMADKGLIDQVGSGKKTKYKKR